MTMTDLLTRIDGTAAFEGLGPFLRSQGVDLCTSAATVLERGTPVYVRSTADPLEVQRLMVESHIRLLFVLDDHDEVIGTVDMRQIAERAEALPWLHFAASRGGG